MASNNRYPPHFKVYAVSEYKAYRTQNPNESQSTSLRAVSSRLDVPESTMAAWIRADAADPPTSGTAVSLGQVPPQPEKKRGRVLDFVAVIIALFAAAPSWLGIQPIQDTQEQSRNALSYFRAVTAPNPASFGALAQRLDTAQIYTEDGSPAARVLALWSEIARVGRNAQVPIEKSQGTELTAIDGGYRSCSPAQPADCREYHALEFDDRNRLRAYSIGDLRIQSALLNREEAASQNEDAKVSLIDGLEIQNGVAFAAEVTNQRTGEVATLEFAGARYAAGEKQFTAEVFGPATLGPNESVTVAGMVKHGRGITLSLPVHFKSQSGNGPERSAVLHIKLN